jgi:alpha-1,6-mannosyltransferase
MFDSVICANGQLAGRLRAAGIGNARTIAMGVEPERFSPALRSAALRADALGSLGLDSGATLLAGIGRFSGEKRWEMVMRAVDGCSRQRPVGMLLIGDGSRRARLEIMAARMDRVAVLPRLDNRAELARMLASADALIHGCEAETFCLVAAEARASGIPMIVPDRGAALDLLAPHAGHVFRAGSERSLQRAIGRFIDGGVELQRAAAVRASGVRTTDQHFTELFALYAQTASMPVFRPMPVLADADSGPELAVARSTARHS